MYQIKAYIHSSHFWTRCQISSMHSSTRKTPQKKTLKISLRHLLVNLKNVWVLAQPMLCSMELSREWQPLIFPPIQASDGALRSVKHKRWMEALIYDIKLAPTQVRFGRYAVSVSRVSQATIILQIFFLLQLVYLLRKIHFFQKDEKNIPGIGL